jgi:glyoxylate reductase
MKPKILVTRRLLPEAHEYLSRHAEVEVGASGRNLTRTELLEMVRDKEGLLALLVDRVDAEIMDIAPALRIIANCAVGHNNIDLIHAQKRGIMVTNTPGVLTETTADLTWALILATARRIPEAERYTRQGKFDGWALDLFLGRDITGKCLGIIGMGRIGRAVALRAQGFRMRTLYYDPHRLDSAEEKRYKAFFCPMDELLTKADVVTLHTSLSTKSHHLIGEKELLHMKNTALLINVSRGPVVDEKALVEALKTGEIWGAGLDVYEQEPDIEPELLQLDNVVLLPHIGSASFETRRSMAMTAAHNLVIGLSGKTPPNLVIPQGRT